MQFLIVLEKTKKKISLNQENRLFFMDFILSTSIIYVFLREMEVRFYYFNKDEDG